MTNLVKFKLYFIFYILIKNKGEKIEDKSFLLLLR